MERLLTDWLPTTRKELEIRHWDEVDVVLFSGDAYVDHPSFGGAVIGRVLEAEGIRVALVPQPDWHGDLRDFKRMGKPRLFFSITAGCMDSMVNHYTANKRLRSDDAYSPNGQHGLRPDRATIVYANILKQLFPDVPVVIGGIEASMRRFSHYDYWSDSVHPPILFDSKADLLVYGMGEETMRQIARTLKVTNDIEACHALSQVSYVSSERPEGDDVLMLPSHEQCTCDHKAAAQAFRMVEEEANRLQSNKRIVQQVHGRYCIVNKPLPPMTEAELDAVYDLPFTRLPHPKYNGKRIPAFEMIRFSINTHRGCFGGCAFCTISMHQGRAVVSRSKASIMREVEQVTTMPDFKGYISDLGGPSANMYKMCGKNRAICERCKRPTCVTPNVCPNLNIDHRPLLDLYRCVVAHPRVKKCFIGSGVRYDLILHDNKDEVLNTASRDYATELITNHVSGRLKIAPEHTSDNVLNIMRKPSFKLFHEFVRMFNEINDSAGLNQQIIPYFISSHPGCTPADMAELAIETKRLNFKLEQVQDFTPTPMTLATEMYRTGIDPYTMKPIFVARDAKEKLAQRQFFFWYLPENRQSIIRALTNMRRSDLIEPLLGQKQRQTHGNETMHSRNNHQQTSEKRHHETPNAHAKKQQKKTNPERNRHR
ncbi:MAG: YgiQ family radical SAM protein [Bacteroidales bacterium]|nr:YgiQ family radical SAM protein [Bacteroidales bacterium]